MKFKATFLIADGKVDRNNETFAPGAVSCPDMLPLTWDFIRNMDHHIGQVTVNQNGDVFEGEFDINEDALKKAWYTPEVSPETIKAVLGFAYPAIEGYTKDTRIIDGGYKEISKCRVTAVTLTMSPNTDPRIQRFREVLK